MQSQQHMYGHFKEQRMDAKSSVIGVGDTMCIQTDFYKARGIRSWEKARYENDIRRQRQQEFFNNQRKLQRMRNKDFDFKPVEKEEPKKDWEFNDSNIKDVVPTDFVSSGNDAWDD